jgi:hypothetical protein
LSTLTLSLSNYLPTFLTRQKIPNTTHVNLFVLEKISPTNVIETQNFKNEVILKVSITKSEKMVKIA